MKKEPKDAWEPMDGNEAAARVAYALSEVIAIYPITPSSTMGELADEWASDGLKNLWGDVPRVSELQSEAGAAGTLHGALSAGSLATTFTASQGLLLMIPAFYKIAGELRPFVAHVAARAIATHALSIFGDHSDVMAARPTGFAMLCSGSVQEAHDFAAVAHSATLESRVPFIHFFDGFRTSHELQKIRTLSNEDLSAMISDRKIVDHRLNGLSPDRPSIRGTAQNPDVFFQGREAANPAYQACPSIVASALDALHARTGRRYRLFDYEGHPEAERVVVMMGSGAEAAVTAADKLNAKGERVGVLRVRLFRPFSMSALLEALPKSARAIAVLDRCKEPGAPAEPLFLDVAAALQEDAGARFGRMPKLIGGRYGLGSKEFTPAMAAAVFAELRKPDQKRRFTVGINDDVSHTSLEFDPALSHESAETFRAVLYGLGADGTVSACKNAVKLVCDNTELNAQGYFVYDSKKSGAVTISHLRFSKDAIRAPYLISEAQYVACHQESLLSQHDVLKCAAEGGIFLLNCPEPENAWSRLPRASRQTVLKKRLRFYAIDAAALARSKGLGGRISTVMQACFFELTGLMPDAVPLLKAAARKAYSSKGPKAVAANEAVLEAAAAALKRVEPSQELGSENGEAHVPSSAPDFVKNVIVPIMEGRGDELPVSAMPVTGMWPVGTARWEKRRLSTDIPAWEPGLCIQCNKCALVCPHAAIRVKAYAGDSLKDAPKEFQRMAWKGREFGLGAQYTVQVAPEDCTGCRLCVEVCPGHDRAQPERKSLSLVPVEPRMSAEKLNWDYFLNLKEAVSASPAPLSVKSSQLRAPLFEFSGACAGCGETPYLKLLTQLFGDRMVVANATGCSSIFGGNLPTTPWTTDAEGRGPAWSNSLFEDNAEFGLGLRLSFDAQERSAQRLLREHQDALGSELVGAILGSTVAGEEGLAVQRARLSELKSRLIPLREKEAWARDLTVLCESLVRRGVWIVGGDGWAYDIGSGGLDHVLRSDAKVNILVLDTEVYSNTGGQASKATPRGAQAKFATSGKALARKDLVLEAITAGTAYVARVALGANDSQTLKALMEAEAYPGPSLIVAYSPCIAHGIDMCDGLSQQKLAVETGYWPLLRFDPRRGAHPLEIDSAPPKRPFREYALRENRYRVLATEHPAESERLMILAQQDLDRRWSLLSKLAGVAEKP